MSNNQDMAPADNQGGDLSATPPAIVAGSSGYSLQPGQRLERRKVKGVSPTYTFNPTAEKDYIVTQSGSVEQFDYEGQSLVDANGVITRGQYNINTEAYSELARFKNVADRKQLLNRLAAIGLYGDQKPSATGFASRDLNAVQDLMLYANSRGRTLDVAVQMLAAEGGGASYTGRTFRPTPKQDLKAVFKQTAQSVLGRNPSDKELQRFIRSYQGMERTEAYGGEAAPNVSVAAEQQIVAQNPDEAAAVGMSQLASIMEQKIRSLA